ncbi:TPA: helix-turn-helix transcriptional regulator [Salmonella enterica subsp. enterica serovar Muenchen]|nr:helix-turn-helix transcriptional regulator [Salmonella enterica]
MQNVICNHILFWVEENIYTGLNVADLALSTGYSRRTLEMWFSEKYNITPGRYLFRRRMTRAAILLRLSTLSVTEIAVLLHHSSNPNFARAFRRFSGKSPKEYRNSSEWDLSVMQASLYYKVNIDTNVSVCYLSDRFLKGETYNCHDSYLYNKENNITRLIKERVTELICNGTKDVYLKGSTSIPDNVKKNREGRLNAKITLGEIVSCEDKSTVIMPGGKFCRYSFYCKWDEYYFHTNHFFIQMMSEHKFKFTGGSCYVHYIGSKDEIYSGVNCEVYVPIR